MYNGSYDTEDTDDYWADPYLRESALAELDAMYYESEDEPFYWYGGECLR